MNQKDKALAVIEDLTGSDFAQDLEYKVFINKKGTKDEKQCAKIINQIYKLAHAITCKERSFCSHPDWEQEIEELYRKL